MAAPKENYDGLSSFPDGINSGIDPSLLTKSQLAYAVNATMRGTFIGPRPEFVPRPLVFSSAFDQTNFETGLYQGACFYKPDTGNEQIIASIGGRLFTIDCVTLAVTDISILNDLNPSTVTQAWLWQSERWVIVRDGISVPIIYDGVASRRAVQFQELGTIAAGGGTVAAGATLTLTVASPGYLGTIGQSVLIGLANGSQEIFQVVSAGGASSNVVLTSINYPGVGNFTAGSALNFNPNNVGIAAAGGSIASSLATVYLKYDYAGAVGSQFKVITAAVFFPVVITVTSISVDKRTLQGTVNNSGSGAIAENEVLTTVANNLPTSVALVSAETAARPAPGSSFTVKVVTPFTGAPNSVVWDGKLAYLATASAPTTNLLSIVVQNNNTVALEIANNSTIFAVAEIPPGRMGCYGIGRNWLCNSDGVSYCASDLVGDPSGSENYDYRDAVLKMVGNIFLAGGGSFAIPVSGDQITAMRFCANLDLALGQGPLQVFTQGSAFSCNAPIDRDTWETMTNPIQTQSLISNGSMSHNATVLANSDIMFRSPDGFRSFILARRDFDTHGNVPISREISRLIAGDASALLSFESSLIFDNRYLTTVRPTQGTNGVYHTALAVMNFDPISTLRGKLPPIWEGEWTGLNAYQLVLARVNLVDRAYALNRNSTTGATELYEILTSDNSRAGDVEWSFESPSLFQSPPEDRQFQRLTNGEMWVDTVDGPLAFQVFYRTDDSSTWVPWRSWTEETNTGSFKPRMGLGQPATACDSETGRTANDGYEFFIKVVVTGKCQWKGARFLSTEQPEPKFKQPKCP